MRLYLDANAIIYLIEGGAALRNFVLSWTDRVESEPDGLLVTSYLSVVECRVKPLQRGDAELLALFEGFWRRERLLVGDVTREILDRTSELRARHRLKTADAIHLATAIAHRASAILTADPAFQRYPDLKVILLDPAAP